MGGHRAQDHDAAPAPPGAVHFRNRGRLPPLYLAVMAVLIGLYLSPLVTGAPAASSYWWTVPAFLLVPMVLVPSVYLYRCSASVMVTNDGLLVRDRLVVPAEKIGSVTIVSGANAAWASFVGMPATPRISGRQNLYGGGFGWGKGVGVEHLRHGGSTWWLLPGPRSEELAEALGATRDRASRSRSGVA